MVTALSWYDENQKKLNDPIRPMFPNIPQTSAIQPIRPISPTTPQFSLGGQPAFAQSSAIKPIQLTQPSQPIQPLQNPFKPIGDFLQKNIIQPTVDTANKAINTVAIPITGLVGAGMTMADQAFNGGKNANNLADATNAQMNDNIKNSFVTPDIASGKASVGEFGQGFTNAGLELAPYFIPGGGGGGALTTKLGSTVADKVATKYGSDLLGNVAGSLARNTADASLVAPTFAAIDAGRQGLAAIGNGGQTGFDPGQSVASGLQAGAFTGLAGVGGDILKPIIKGTVKGVVDAQTGPNAQAGFAKIPGGKAPVDKTNPLNYKTVDEFIKAQGEPLYHGSPNHQTIRKEGLKTNPNGVNLLGDGVYLTRNRAKAENYSIPTDLPRGTTITQEMRSSGVVEGYIPKDTKIFKPESRSELKNLTTKDLQNKGYGGVEVNGETVIFDPAKVKTREQLTDLYNQAHSTKLVDPTPQVGKTTAPIVPETVKPAPATGTYVKQPVELKKAIDAQIAKDNPNLASSITDESAFPDGIPKVRPEDVMRVAGLSPKELGIPPRYVSKTATPLDKLTSEYELNRSGGKSGVATMSEDDFLAQLTSSIEHNVSKTGTKETIAQLRNDPKIIQSAKDALASEQSYFQPKNPNIIEPSKLDKQVYSNMAQGGTAPAPRPIKAKPVVEKATAPIFAPAEKGPAPSVKTRGFVKTAKASGAVSKEAKAQVAGTYEVKSNTKLAADTAARIAKSDVKAYDFALNTASDEGTATAIALAQKYRKAGNFDLEANLINEKARRLTEAGREIQAAAMLDKLSPEGAVMSAAHAIQRYNETAKKQIAPLDGKLAKEFSNKAKAIEKLPEGRDKQIALGQLGEDLANLIPSKDSSKFITVWKAGLLTSPRTSLRNIVGNTGHGVAEVLKDVPAALNDKLLSLKTGKREMTATLNGTISGTKKGATAAKDMALLGFDPEGSIAKFNVNHITWKNNKFEQGLKHYTNIVFRNMGAQDKVFYHSSFARSLYDQAGAIAKNEGRSGDAAFIKTLVDSPTERMLTNATKDAQVAVFQNSNAASRIAGSIKMAAERAGLKPIVDVVMPFTGVPSSIAGQMIAYSPIGLIKGIAKDGKILAGKVTKETLPDFQRQASQEIGRGVIGTGILALGSYLTAQGLMTGQPKDAKEAALWQTQGKQANSVMVGGQWRSINSIGPEALILLAGSKMASGKDPAVIAANIGSDFTKQTFLQGMSAPLDALSDPERYAQTYAANQTASLIPNIVKDAAKSGDSVQRETKGADFGSTVSNTVKSGIPGLRNDLLPKRDAMGNPMPQEPTGPAAFVDLFNSKTPIKNTVVDELARLHSVGQDSLPSTLTANQKVLGQDVKLTPQQLDQLEQSTGQPITQQFNDLMQTPEYQGASDELKSKTLDNIVQGVRDQAKTNLATGLTATGTGTGSLIDTAKLTSAAQLTLAKDSFDKSGKSYQVVGDTVLRRDAQGTITATPKVKYDYQVGTATLTQQKNNDDLSGWMKTAQSQLDSIQKQLQDPSIDPLDAVSLQNDAQTLVNNMAKYAGYGGFTKGSGTGSSSTGAASAKAAATAVLNATKAAPTAKLPTAPTVSKATYRQVPVQSTSPSTATNKYAPIKVSGKSASRAKDRSRNV